jgi:NTP pyrophosphatase (non-canonical NTP hydrolase)
MSDQANAVQQRAIVDVLAERVRQDARWGEQNHDPFTYLVVMFEEAGETAEAALHTRFGGPKAAGLRGEAVQLAAVALAIVECLDRGAWRWPVPAEYADALEARIAALEAAIDDWQAAIDGPNGVAAAEFVLRRVRQGGAAE